MDDNDACPVCGLSSDQLFPDLNGATPPLRRQQGHVHACVKRDLGEQMFAAAANALHGGNAASTSYRWPKCAHEAPSINDLAVHLHESHSRSVVCGFHNVDGEACAYRFQDDFKYHLEAVHGLICTESPTTPSTVRFCSTCTTWVVGARHVRAHYASHVADAVESMRSDAFARSYRSGRGTRLCPFHVVDVDEEPESRLQSFPNNGNQAKHISAHIVDAHVNDKNMSCPFLGCALAEVKPSELADHLVNDHDLAIAGYVNPGMKPRRPQGVLKLLIMAPPAKSLLVEGRRRESYHTVALPLDDDELESLKRPELVILTERYGLSPYRAGYKKKNRMELIEGIQEAVRLGDVPTTIQDNSSKDTRERAFDEIDGVSETKRDNVPTIELQGFASTTDVPLSSATDGKQRPFHKCTQAEAVCDWGQPQLLSGTLSYDGPATNGTLSATLGSVLTSFGNRDMKLDVFL